MTSTVGSNDVCLRSASVICTVRRDRRPIPTRYPIGIARMSAERPDVSAHTTVAAGKASFPIFDLTTVGSAK